MVNWTDLLRKWASPPVISHQAFVDIQRHPRRTDGLKIAASRARLTEITGLVATADHPTSIEDRSDPSRLQPLLISGLLCGTKRRLRPAPLSWRHVKWFL